LSSICSVEEGRVGLEDEGYCGTNSAARKERLDIQMKGQETDETSNDSSLGKGEEKDVRNQIPISFV